MEVKRLGEVGDKILFSWRPKEGSDAGQGAEPEQSAGEMIRDMTARGYDVRVFC